MVQVDEIEVKEKKALVATALNVLWPIGLCGVGGQSGESSSCGIELSSFRKLIVFFALHILVLITFIAFYATTHYLMCNQ
jgi:hypothetical protein